MSLTMLAILWVNLMVDLMEDLSSVILSEALWEHKNNHEQTVPVS